MTDVIATYEWDKDRQLYVSPDGRDTIDWKEPTTFDFGPTLEAALANGYRSTRVIDGMVCAVMRMIFTTGVFYGLDEVGYRGRFCFDTKQNAELFLKDWDGKTVPTIGEDGCTAIKS